MQNPGNFARAEKMCIFRPHFPVPPAFRGWDSVFRRSAAVHGHPEWRFRDPGRPHPCIWVHNDRKKISFHKGPAHVSESGPHVTPGIIDELVLQGAIYCVPIDAQPKPSRFGGREGRQNDRMVPNCPRRPTHVPTCSPHVTSRIIKPRRALHVACRMSHVACRMSHVAKKIKMSRFL